MNGNSVIKLNSARRLSYIAGDLLLSSSRACGRPCLRAGMGKTPGWLPCASELRYKTCFAVVFAVFIALFSRRRRRCSVELTSPPQRKPASAKLATASLVPCETSPPVLVA